MHTCMRAVGVMLAPNWWRVRNSACVGNYGSTCMLCASYDDSAR